MLGGRACAAPGKWLTAPVGHDVDYYYSVPYQLSPDYCGSPVWGNYTCGAAGCHRAGGVVNPMHYEKDSIFGGSIDTIVGGGFIESFAQGGPEAYLSEQKRRDIRG